MKTLTNRTFQIFRKQDGSKFYATLTAPNTYISTSKFPKRLLQVQEPSPVIVGDVVKAPSRDSVLLMEFVSMINGCRSYVAAHVNAAYLWKRPLLEEDPVSKLMRQTGLIDMGYVFTTQDQLEDAMIEHMYVDQFSFYTGQDVQIGDIVDGKKVSNIRQTLGVKFVTIK